jgi:hypothetical protein
MTSQTAIQEWQEANQRHLMSALHEVQEELAAYLDGSDAAGRVSGAGAAASRVTGGAQGSGDMNGTVRVEGSVVEGSAVPAPFALDTLTTLFTLTAFERRVLLLCAGIELDAKTGALVARIQGSPGRMLPTFSTALAVFHDAHWSALSPEAPLRYWRLLDAVGGSPGQSFMTQPLKIDENILFYLTGVHYQDQRLSGILHAEEPVYRLVPSQRQSAELMLQAYYRRTNGQKLPLMELQGVAKADKLSVAAYACTSAGFRLYSIAIQSLPLSSEAVGEWVRIWDRQAALFGWGLLVDANGLDTGDKSRESAAVQLLEQVHGWVFLSTDQWSPALKRPRLTMDIRKPDYNEQLQLWTSSLGLEDRVNGDAAADRGMLGRVVSQFNLSAGLIGEVSETVAVAEAADGLPERLWKACCVATRPRLDDLIQRIDPVAQWADIVLPEDQLTLLRELAMQVKQRAKVYGDWGFGAVSSRGLGISALFTGESGTGKTMASEVLANELRLDLYRVDLSQVVNKYIGETEKNLKKVFDAAEDGGAILLFDEADALFGKRSEVKDSHDRYGNIEVSYLLQRMESYRGLAILTTNLKSALDKAFYRRIRFVVQFPFPDAQSRAAIWRRVFPSGTPTKDLDPARLSKLSIPGGNIRNIALNAAFIAAAEGMPVHMAHVGRALRSEYNKLERSLNAIETGGII